jgi:hypothetical protein
MKLSTNFIISLENLYTMKYKYVLFHNKYYKISELYAMRYMEYQFHESLRESSISMKERVRRIFNNEY